MADLGNRLRMFILAGCVGLALMAPGTSSATPSRGGPGGQPFNLDCGGDSVLAGIAIRAGAVVDSVEAICMRVGADGAWSGDYSSRGKAGGTGGGPLSLYCDANWAVTGIHGRAGALIDRLGVRCGRLGAQGGQVRIVEGNIQRGAGGGNGGVAFDDSCPAGQAGRGVFGRSSTYVDQIALACHLPAVPAAQPPALARERPAIGPGREAFTIPLPKIEIGGIGIAEGVLYYERPGTIRATIKNVGTARLADAVWRIQTPTVNQYSNDALSKEGHTGPLEPNASIDVSAPWFPRASGTRRIDLTVDHPSGGSRMASLARDVTVTPKIVSTTLHDETYPGSSSLSADATGRQCEVKQLAGRRYEFEGVQYDLFCRWPAGGRFTIEVFKDVTLRNGWKVKGTYLGVARGNTNEHTIVQWEVEPARNGTSAYGRVHVALEPGQNIGLDIRVEVEGPVDLSY